jgi:hypothetical protein
VKPSVALKEEEIMTTTVLGVSGSPIGDGNTDRVVQRVLAATGSTPNSFACGT